MQNPMQTEIETVEWQNCTNSFIEVVYQNEKVQLQVQVKI